MKLLHVAFLIGLLQCSCLARKNYEEYILVDIVPKSDRDVTLLRGLMQLWDGDEVDFWVEPRGAGQLCTMMVKKDSFRDEVMPLLAGSDIPFALKDYNLHRAIEENFEEIRRIQLAGNHSVNLDNFNDLNTIYRWLDALVSKCPKGFKCEVYSLGDSHLGKPIKSLKITKPGVTRRSWYVDATTHAREWITTATILKIIDHLMFSSDSKAKLLLEKYDWYFVPVVNPDGYDYSWTKERTWRKNLRKFTKCIGVDLNRNFASSNWAKEGSSNIECSQTYHGPSAGSENETMAISKELSRIGKNAVVLFSLHSFGNMYLIPFGNTVNFDGKKCRRTDDHDEIMVALDAAAKATEAAYNTVWERGNACEVIYPTTGTTDDYAKDKVGIKYCVVPELRGKGFVVAPSQIHPSFVEIFEGIVALEKNIKP